MRLPHDSFKIVAQFYFTAFRLNVVTLLTNNTKKQLEGRIVGGRDTITTRIWIEGIYRSLWRKPAQLGGRENEGGEFVYDEKEGFQALEAKDMGWFDRRGFRTNYLTREWKSISLTS